MKVTAFDMWQLQRANVGKVTADTELKRRYFAILSKKMRADILIKLSRIN